LVSQAAVRNALARGPPPRRRRARVRDDVSTDVVTLASLHEHAVALAARSSRGDQQWVVVAVHAPPDRASTEVLEALWLLVQWSCRWCFTATPLEIHHILRETVCDACRGPRPVARHRHRWPSDDGGGRRQVLVIAMTRRRARHRSGRCSRRAHFHRRSSTRQRCVASCTHPARRQCPRGVQHSHETLLAGTDCVPADTSSRRWRRFPAGHIASLLGLLRPLSVGGTTVVMTLERTSCVCAHRRAPAQHQRRHPVLPSTLLDERTARGDISSLRRFLVGAGVCRPRSSSGRRRTALSAGDLRSTEHPAISSGGARRRGGEADVHQRACRPGNEVRLLDEDGDDVPVGDVGEIVARGPEAVLGYRDAALDDDAFVDVSWFRTWRPCSDSTATAISSSPIG